jgi:hypothetical protein
MLLARASSKQLKSETRSPFDLLAQYCQPLSALVPVCADARFRAEHDVKFPPLIFELPIPWA